MIMLTCANCGHRAGVDYVAMADECPACHVTPFPELVVISGQDFHDALHADALDPRAKAIADAITGARGGHKWDRIGGLYENAYRGALAGLAMATVTRPYIAADGERFATRQDAGEASAEDIADSRDS
ncbi:hypothetical protein [Agromyces sp. NPDC058104]|uniref:hypothetical protein n=1 Tax=Agromyces sp. NPDC058104 TaxID=3346342 RepID=UPI0036D947B0